MSKFISLQQAIDMTKRYRENKDSIIAPGFSSREILPICDTFDKATVETLVSKAGAVSIRLYYGMNEDLTVRPILVAVNDKNEDILPSDASTVGDDDILNDTIKCPPICPPPSPLNE